MALGSTYGGVGLQGMGRVGLWRFQQLLRAVRMHSVLRRVTDWPAANLRAARGRKAQGLDG